MHRRTFVKSGTALMASAALQPLFARPTPPAAPIRLALVGTGIRGTTLWGQNLVENYAPYVRFVGISDHNAGRLAFAKRYMGVDCAAYTDFEEMMRKERPEWLVVTTMDATHHQFIIRGMELGANIITEKPLTTDEDKCRAILAAQERTGKQVIVTFNYRHNPHNTKIKELLMENSVGRLTSVDFHWYLNVYHGASYFRRWHGERDKGGTLWVHKATHHFDLLNWWIDSDPVEVRAYGSLEHYGHNNAFRGANCRNCAHRDRCDFHWDITQDKYLTQLYTDNEGYDGYIRDNCLWREEIDIYDKMSAQIIYANGVTVNYSLTTYSPYEGWRIGFNGFEGRLDSWEDIPYQSGEYSAAEQAALHAREMQQGREETPTEYNEVVLMKNFDRDYRSVKIPKYRYGHGGGDQRMLDYIFVDPSAPDPLGLMAGTRDGALSILIGIAARRSIEEQRAVRIEELTDLALFPVRPKG